MTVERMFLLHNDKASLQQIALESEQWGVKIKTVETIEQCLSLAHSIGAEMVFALVCQAEKIFWHINRLRMEFPCCRCPCCAARQDGWPGTRTFVACRG